MTHGMFIKYQLIKLAICSNTTISIQMNNHLPHVTITKLVQLKLPTYDRTHGRRYVGLGQVSRPKIGRQVNRLRLGKQVGEQVGRLILIILLLIILFDWFIPNDIYTLNLFNPYRTQFIFSLSYIVYKLEVMDKHLQKRNITKLSHNFCPGPKHYPIPTQ